MYSKISMIAVGVSKLRRDDMTAHGLLMVTFGGLAALFNYLFMLTMSIFLPGEQYGILLSLLSILTIITVFTQAITLATARFASKLKDQSNRRTIRYIWLMSFKKTMFISLGMCFVIAALSPFILGFLHVNNVFYLVVLFLAIFLIAVSSVNLGILQGLQRFLPMGFLQALQGFLRLGVALILVYLGLGVAGGVSAIPISFAVIVIISFLVIRKLGRTEGKEQEASFPGFGNYLWFSFVAIFSLTVLTNIDVVLARHYLDPGVAGNYAAISVLGKIVFFAPIGVSTAMFPKTAGFKSNADSRRVFFKAMFQAVLIAAAILLIYGLFPNLVSGLLFDSGNKYPSASSHVFMYGIAMALLAISFLLVNYLLSISKTKFVYFLIGVMSLQLILIALFHSDISQMVNIMLICGICTLGLLIPFCVVALRPAKSKSNS